MQTDFKPLSAKMPDIFEVKKVIASLKNSDITQKHISEATGINQGQISKLINGQFQKIDGHAFKLFKYAKMHLDASRTNATDYKKEISAQAIALWDKTEPSGKKLIALLAAIKEFLDTEK